MGKGVPDLMVGARGATYLLEVKKPEQRDHAIGSPSEKITARWQAEWRAKWRGGPVAVVYSVAEALATVGALGEPSEAFSPGVVEARRTARRT
jgi:hypothetical protein